MMLIGMALYRLGVLQGQRSVQAYRNMAIGGFTLGLLINAYEIGAALGAPNDSACRFLSIATDLSRGPISHQHGLDRPRHTHD